MTVTRGQIEGWFKQRYGEVERALPDFAVLQQRVKFSESTKLGDYFNFPVVLTRSHGVTFNGSDPGTAYTLNAAISMVTKNAQVKGSETTIRDNVSYGALSAASKAGPEAFGDVMSELVLSIKESHAFYEEANLLYGQTNIGVIQGRSDDSGTSQTFQITKASWSPGLWAQMENALCDVWDDDWNPKRNSAGTMKVTAVDPDERTVTFLGTEAEMDTIVAGDYITFVGHTSATTPTFEVAAGLDKIVTNTDTLFNISAATYNLWRGNTYSVGSAELTMAKVQAALAKAVTRGLMEDVQVLVSIYSWTDLLNDLSALRRFADETKREMTLGSNSIKFYGSNGGALELMPHAMLKSGEAFIAPLKRLRRVGSTEPTFRVAGADNEFMYTNLADANGAQVRCYSDLGLIATAPAKFVKLTGIVNQSLPNASSET